MFPLLDSESEINTHFLPVNFTADVLSLTPSSSNRLGDGSLLTPPSPSERKKEKEKKELQHDKTNK